MLRCLKASQGQLSALGPIHHSSSLWASRAVASMYQKSPMTMSYCSDGQGPTLPSLLTWGSPRCTEPGEMGSLASSRAPGQPHPRSTQNSLAAPKHGAPVSAPESLQYKGRASPATCQPGSAWQGV